MKLRTELPDMTKEQKEKLNKIKPGDVLRYCDDPEKYRMGFETQTGVFLVWDVWKGTKPNMNLEGQIISDEDPYGQAPDSLDIDQVIGEASERETKLAHLCSEWRGLKKAAGLDIPVEIPEGTTWEQFKKIRGYK